MMGESNSSEKEGEGTIDLEHNLQETEETKRDSVVLPYLKKCNDILYHPKTAPMGFFACLAVLLELFHFLCGFFFLFSHTNQPSSQLETRTQRAADPQEGNVMKAEFWVSHGVDIYARQDEQECSRLQNPAPMIFSNEKLVGPPAPKKSGCFGYPRLQSFGSKEEPLRHTLMLHRNRNPNSVQSPIAITESLARQSVLCDQLPMNDDINETVAKDSTKYEDVVKESHKISDPFGWLK